MMSLYARMGGSPLPVIHAHASCFRGTVQRSFHRERITLDGALVVGEPSASPSRSADAFAAGQERPPPGQQQRGHSSAAPTAPSAGPVSDEQLAALVQMFKSSQRVVVITGAGVSTESNIPDYRGPQGAYTTGFTPMTHQQFMATPERRARYWARSFLGWGQFAGSVPNATHEGLARLQHLGHVGAVITQNVDRLHHKAGTKDVLEMHGTTHEVKCMSCGTSTCRHEFQRMLAGLNPAAAERAVSGALQSDLKVAVRRPDGDVELQDADDHFAVPPCATCGGILKPDVVFFGDSLPPARADRAMELCRGSDMVLVVGSSLMVWSAFRIVRAAKDAGARLAIVNAGTTRAEALADLKIDALASDVITKLVRQLDHATAATAAGQQ